jgi:hypothetical protein
MISLAFADGFDLASTFRFLSGVIRFPSFGGKISFII